MSDAIEISAATGRIALLVERLNAHTWRFTMRGPKGEIMLLLDEEDAAELRAALAPS